jgi:hypothetical protein
MKSAIYALIASILFIGNCAAADLRPGRVREKLYDDVRVQIILNYNDSHQTMCRALSNIPGRRIVAKFDVYPTGYPSDPHAIVGPITLTNTWSYIFQWPEDTKPDPICKVIYIRESKRTPRHL